ncbi:reductase [Clavibacter michiganensis]|nr:reductase [Clavibacter michiganensis]
MRRVLILGGTAWLGHEIARQAAADAEVFCLARGESGQVPDGVQLIVADRTTPGAYDYAVGEWDEVIELAYDPAFVEPALDALAARARHWTLVSSVSVYERNDEPGADESATLVEPKDLSEYPDAKVAAERTSAARLGDKLLIVRPGLIAGPGDLSDRFGYWMARLAQSGPVLAPVPDGRRVQVIDVADLASWILAAGRLERTGTFNAVGHSHTFEEFLSAVQAATSFTGDFVYATDARLLELDVRYWSGPKSLPLWLPADAIAFAERSNAAYLAADGPVRPLADTINRMLQDELARGLDRERRSGLSLSEEAAVLARH